MLNVQAVYKNGVFRPKNPVALTDGEEVQMVVSRQPHRDPQGELTAEEQDYVRRLNAAVSIDDMFAVMDTAPQTDPDFDVVRAMNESRRLTGFRVPGPDPEVSQ